MARVRASGYGRDCNLDPPRAFRAGPQRLSLRNPGSRPQRTTHRGDSMNFEWTQEQQAFRGRVRDFLARELPPDFEHLSRGGPASKEVTEFSMKFCAKLAKEN